MLLVNECIFTQEVITDIGVQPEEHLFMKQSPEEVMYDTHLL
jgi:hypothetical protein